MRRLVLVLLLGSCVAAEAEWSKVAQLWPQNMPESTMNWFRQQTSKNGSCCSVADGMPAEWERRGTKYFVFDEMSQKQLYPADVPTVKGAVWREVPEQALIISANPTGRGVVWFMNSRDDDGLRNIRCFVPGAES